MTENNNSKQYVSQPLQFMIDIQLGPDGHPWIRLQLATPGMTTSIVFPNENAEDVISAITRGIRQAVGKVHKKQVDTIVPDFTGIGVEE